MEEEKKDVIIGVVVSTGVSLGHELFDKSMREKERVEKQFLY